MAAARFYGGALPRHENDGNGLEPPPGELGGFRRHSTQGRGGSSLVESWDGARAGSHKYRCIVLVCHNHIIVCAGNVVFL